MTKSKTIPVMTTCKELIAFFEAIPTENWGVGDYEVSPGCYCALGHLGERENKHSVGAADAAYLLGRQLVKHAKDTAADDFVYLPDLIEANDGNYWNDALLGPMPDNPKDRVLALLRWGQEQGL